MFHQFSSILNDASSLPLTERLNLQIQIELRSHCRTLPLSTGNIPTSTKRSFKHYYNPDTWSYFQTHQAQTPSALSYTNPTYKSAYSLILQNFSMVELSAPINVKTTSTTSSVPPAYKTDMIHTKSIIKHILRNNSRRMARQVNIHLQRQLVKCNLIHARVEFF